MARTKLPPRKSGSGVRKEGASTKASGSSSAKEARGAAKAGSAAGAASAAAAGASGSSASAGQRSRPAAAGASSSSASASSKPGALVPAGASGALSTLPVAESDVEPELDSSTQLPGLPPISRQRASVERQIAHYRSTTELLIPKMAFQRTVRELCMEVQESMNIAPPGLRWHSQALLALQEATEEYLVGYMEDANLCVAHAKRVTLMLKDFTLTKRLRGAP
eukprot:TRINITY_DN13099_c0_g1_i1.p1 TRINITY_DN13099_c0_g1~~TRINITY_DN13099_c0_g1_i1.p1  ORF type:complete len:234 (-),score=34.64 TRINITY_DN13099_c0_g1_i1:336-1001(-)